MRPALFLDRDGVINHDIGYLFRKQDFRFVDGILPFIRRWVAQGYLPIIVTNQSGIARGYYTSDDVNALHTWLQQQFSEAGLPHIPYYFCPHHPVLGPAGVASDCDCRKPKPGMFLQAISEHNVDASRSIMVGDKLTDIEAARSAGVNTCILVSDKELTAPADVMRIKRLSSLQ